MMRVREQERVLLERRKQKIDIRAMWRSQMGAFSVNKAWEIGFALLFIGILIPIGISQLNNVDTSGWDATQVVVWGLIGTVAILSVAFAVYRGVSGGTGGGRRRRGGM